MVQLKCATYQLPIGTVGFVKQPLRWWQLEVEVSTAGDQENVGKAAPDASAELRPDDSD